MWLLKPVRTASLLTHLGATELPYFAVRRRARGLPRVPDALEQRVDHVRRSLGEGVAQ